LEVPVFVYLVFSSLLVTLIILNACATAPGAQREQKIFVSKFLLFIAIALMSYGWLARAFEAAKSEVRGYRLPASQHFILACKALPCGRGIDETTTSIQTMAAL
jgi:hypothetical protein